METKICKTCRQEKPVVEFNKHKTTKDGLCPICKNCQSEYNKRYREKNRDRIKAYKSSDYYRAKCIIYRQNYDKKHVNRIKHCLSCGAEYYAKDLSVLYCDNPECRKAHQQEYYKQYRTTEKYQKQKEEYYKTHKEHIKLYARKYIKRDYVKEHRKRYAEEYHQRPEVKERYRNRIAEERKTESGYIKNLYYRIKTRGETSLKLSDIDNLMRNNNICYYCGKELKEINGKKTIDHRIPLSRGGSNEIENMVVACEHCNYSKSDKTDLEYFKYIKTGA
jgi:5-methylcytosine-specific restriction endonuclease McrA